MAEENGTPSVGAVLKQDVQEHLQPIGRRLVEARQRKNMSIGEVARALHLDARHIEALEAEDFQKLPSAVFIKGYLRNYARLLGLDEQSIVEAYLQRNQAEAPMLKPISTVRMSSTPWTLSDEATQVIKVVVGVVVTGLLLWIGSGLYSWWRNRGDAVPVAPLQLPGSVPEPAEPSSSIIAPAPLPTPPVAPVQPSLPTLPEGSKQAGEPPTVPEVRTDTQQAQDGPAVPEAREEVIAAPGELVLRLAADSWVEVYDRHDKALLLRVAKAGDVHRLRGEPPFRVVLGAAAGVEVEYNGVPFDTTPFVRGNVAKFTVGP